MSWIIGIVIASYVINLVALRGLNKIDPVRRDEIWIIPVVWLFTPITVWIACYYCFVDRAGLIGSIRNGLEICIEKVFGPCRD